jgi:hypothetical protein
MGNEHQIAAQNKLHLGANNNSFKETHTTTVKQGAAAPNNI